MNECFCQCCQCCQSHQSEKRCLDQVTRRALRLLNVTSSYGVPVPNPYNMDTLMQLSTEESL
jgi:hypothetical protein